MRPTLILSLSLLLMACHLSAQELPETEDEFEKEYQERIKKEYLFYPPVYIPKDLTDCFVQLNKLTDKVSRQKFKAMSEEDVRRKLYFSLGKWITQNWGFYGGSRLSHFLKGLGVHHPEDMAVFIMLTYHRNLNRRELKVKDLITEFQEKRNQEWEEQKKRRTIIHEETRKRPKEGEQNQ
ncbi:MAG: DUF6794 domain-containing protein [Bacteroidota bacterium]